VRRAKLYYLRGRSGKRARIAERARTAGPSGDAPTANDTEAAD
jgi:large subunit ribosomal protein L19